MPPFLATTPLPFLEEIVALFALSTLIAYLSYRLSLPPIAGFLLAGVLIGPSVLGLVEDQELIDMMAEVGVILLLFTIGLEFSLKQLSRISRAIFLGGGLQVGVTVGVVAVGLAAFGVAWPASIFTGGLVALSSTAIVLGLLADRAETDTPTGQLSLAILIFQDLAVVAMVMLVPMLGGEGGTFIDLLVALAKALLVIVLVVFLSRKVVPDILEKVVGTRRQEIFVLAIVAICFGTAWLTSLAGVSLALGAFMAGLIISESPYSEQAFSQVLPLRTVFNAVFFVSMGMLLDVGYLISQPLLLIGVAAGVLLVKALITTGSILALGYPIRIAAATGVGLAEIGEFSFVLQRAGSAAGLTPAGLGPEGEQLFIAATVVLMILTPLLMQAGPKLGALLQETPLNRVKARQEVASGETEKKLEDHVIIVGYGPAGRRLARVLNETGIPFILIELNPESAKEARENGMPAIYGDASRPHILEQAGVNRAKLCVVIINDRAAARRITRQAHFENPTLQIIVRTRFLTDIQPLREAGANTIIPEELETTVRVFSQVLGAYMIPSDEIDRYVRDLRSEDYEVFRSKGPLQDAHLMVLKGLDEEGLHTRAVAVYAGAFAEGKTLENLQLRKQYNLTVLAVRRDGRTIGNPAGDFHIKAGDRLVIVGASEQFVRCGHLFRETPID